MTPLSIILDGDGCWPDLATKQQTQGTLAGVAALPGGTLEGNPTVTFRIDMPDGSVVLAQTTMRLFILAADSFRARYGDLR